MDKMTSRSLITGWLAALWSGEYDKIEGTLKHDDQFCVQGVVLDQVARSGMGGWSGGERHGEPTTFQYDQDNTSWDIGKIEYKRIRLLLGLDECISDEHEDVLCEHVLEDDTFSMSLSRYVILLNDRTDLTFPEMADILYSVYTKALDVNLPPKREIKALAENGPCEDKEYVSTATEGETVPVC